MSPEYKHHFKDTSYDNMEHLGFDLHPHPSNTWKITYKDMISQKAV